MPHTYREHQKFRHIAEWHQVQFPGSLASKSTNTPYRNYKVKKKVIDVVREMGIKYYT